MARDQHKVAVSLPTTTASQSTLTRSLKLAVIPAILALLLLVFNPNASLASFFSFSSSSTVATSANSRLVYQFPNRTWVENIGVRANGNLLVTLVTTPELWEIENPASGDATARLVHHFEGELMMTGITEIAPDVFAVASTQTLWKIDFSSSAPASISKIVTMPSAKCLNGMDTLDAERGIILAVDSSLGAIWRINVRTGEHAIVLRDDATMAANLYLGTWVGIDGLRILLADEEGGADYVYYNNCPRRLYCRVRIDRATGKPMGPYELIAENTMADDFALDADGVGYLAGLIDNVVTKVFPNGTRETLAGSAHSAEYAGGTSAAFGRTEKDRDVLYVTTGGVWGIPVNATYFEGGKIMALRV